MRLAKLSFDLWGALSPTGSRSPPGTEQSSQESDKPPEEEETKNEHSPPEQASAKRTISQAELESSLFKVRLKSILSYFCITCWCLFLLV